jgi:hypothetical protein
MQSMACVTDLLHELAVSQKRNDELCKRIAALEDMVARILERSPCVIPPDNAPTSLRLTTVARAIGCRRDLIRRGIAAGEITAERQGRYWSVSMAEAAAYYTRITGRAPRYLRRR